MTDYEKELEVRNEILASLLAKQNPGETVYMIEPKPDRVFAHPNTGLGSASETLRFFYMSLNEAFIAYANKCLTDPITNGVSGEVITRIKGLIDIYEYNIRTESKIKVFG